MQNKTAHGSYLTELTEKRALLQIKKTEENH